MGLHIQLTIRLTHHLNTFLNAQQQAKQLKPIVTKTPAKLKFGAGIKKGWNYLRSQETVTSGSKNGAQTNLQQLVVEGVPKRL